MRYFCTLILCTFVSIALAQTPIANRVKSVVQHLPQKAAIVAKYTDNDRHCLYYIYNGRLYKYDVVKNANDEVDFTTRGYRSIDNAFIEENGAYLFIITETTRRNQEEPINRKDLWRIDTMKGKAKKIDSGFSVKRKKEGFEVKRADDCINPNARAEKRQWNARTHVYDFEGKPSSTTKSYVIKK